MHERHPLSDFCKVSSPHIHCSMRRTHASQPSAGIVTHKNRTRRDTLSGRGCQRHRDRRRSRNEARVTSLHTCVCPLPTIDAVAEDPTANQPKIQRSSFRFHPVFLLFLRQQEKQHLFTDRLVQSCLLRLHSRGLSHDGWTSIFPHQLKGPLRCEVRAS